MIIGYGVNQENTVKYEVGKTYTFNGNLNKRNNGFFFYKSLGEAAKQYKTSLEFITVFQFEVWGEIAKTDNYFKTNQIKVDRIIPVKELKNSIPESLPIYKYDKNDNLVYFKDESEHEIWSEYDQNNREIHTWNNKGYDCVKEYNQAGILIRLIDNDGEQRFNDKGSITYIKDFTGTQYWREYDKIHSKDSNGNEEWREYYDCGKRLRSIKGNIYGKNYEEKFNPEGLVTYKKMTDGSEEWFEYNDRGDTVGYRDSTGENWTIEIK